MLGGYTGGTDFPTTPGAYDTTVEYPGDEVGFITRVAPDGSHLEWSTLLGDSGTHVTGLVLDRQENVTATGTGAFPPISPTTPGAWLDIPPGVSGRNVLVSRLSADGSALIWSALFGGSNDEYPQA